MTLLADVKQAAATMLRVSALAPLLLTLAATVAAAAAARDAA